MGFTFCCAWPSGNKNPTSADARSSTGYRFMSCFEKTQSEYQGRQPHASPGKLSALEPENGTEDARSVVSGRILRKRPALSTKTAIAPQLREVARRDWLFGAGEKGFNGLMGHEVNLLIGGPGIHRHGHQ